MVYLFGHPEYLHFRQKGYHTEKHLSSRRLQTKIRKQTYARKSHATEIEKRLNHYQQQGRQKTYRAQIFE